MYQQITIIGNLGKDPELRFTPSGDQVASFSVATSKSWTGKDGQRNERTIWFRVTAWLKLAELASEYLKKGSRVLVVGEMEEPQAYVDREGKPRASLEMRAQTIRFLTPKGEGGMDPNNPGSAGAVQGQMIDDDSIPF